MELRAHPEEPVHPGISASERAEVVAEFEKAGVEILTVAGYVRVAADGDDDAIVAQVAELVDLAHDLGAPYVRVFPGGGDQDPETADAAAARRLGAAAPHAADRGVTILLETHDSHRAGAEAARVTGTVGHPNIGVIWDVMHTWLSGEDPVDSRLVLAPYLGYVQVKDIASAEDTTPLALGAGVLPLTECLDTLAPDTWVCWEYEKRWYQGIPELPGLLSAGREFLLRVGAPKQ